MVFAVRRLQYIASTCWLTKFDVVWLSVGSVVLNDDFCYVAAYCEHFALSVALAQKLQVVLGAVVEWYRWYAFWWLDVYLHRTRRLFDC